MTITLSDEDYERRQHAMSAAILANLDRCKRDAVLRPVYEGLINIALYGSFLSAALMFMSPNSAGGSLLIFVCVGAALNTIKSFGKAFYTLLRPGNDPYARWEQKFAEIMPYVPHDLRLQAINTLGAARMRTISYIQAVRFLQIVSHLPQTNRYPYRPPLTAREVGEKMTTIGEWLDNFFDDYEGSDGSSGGGGSGSTADAASTTMDGECGDAAIRPNAPTKLKAAIRKFLQQLATADKGFSCLNIVGKPGVGKTHFARRLMIEISKALGTAFPHEEVSVKGDASALEGSPTTPGVLLEALARIGRTEKPYGAWNGWLELG